MRPAAVLLSLLSASCGIVVSFDSFNTAPPPKAVATSASPRAPITVYTLHPGTIVAFHDANGEVVEVQFSGADGVAASTAAASLVTIDADTMLVTYAGVEPGMVLRLTPELDATVAGTLHLRIPYAAARFAVSTFASADAPVEVEPSDSALGDGRGELPFTASDVGSDRMLTIFASEENDGTVACIVKSGISPTTGPTTAIELAGPWVSPEPVELSLTMPLTASAAAYTRLSLQAVVGGQTGGAACPGTTTPVDPASTHRRSYLLSSLSSDVIVAGAVGWPENGFFCQVRVERRGPSRSSVENVDLSTEPVATAKYIPSARTLRWSGGPVTRAGAIADLGVTSSDPAGKGVRWVFIEPASVTEQRLPQLPPVLAARAPAPSDERVAGTIEIIGGDAIPDLTALHHYWTARPGAAFPVGTLRAAKCSFGNN